MTSVLMANMARIVSRTVSVKMDPSVTMRQDSVSVGQAGQVSTVTHPVLLASMVTSVVISASVNMVEHVIMFTENAFVQLDTRVSTVRFHAKKVHLV